MDAAEQMLIEWRLTSLSHRFAHHLDHGDLDALVGLFSADGVYDRSGPVHRGHAEIRDGLRKRPNFVTRHLLTNFFFRSVGGDAASAVVSAVVFHGSPQDGEGPIDYATENGRVVEFHDEYVNTPDGWRIAFRAVRPIFQPKVWP